MKEEYKEILKGTAGCFGSIVIFFAALWLIVICCKIFVWLITL